MNKRCNDCELRIADCGLDNEPRASARAAPRRLKPAALCLALIGVVMCGCAQKLTYERWQSIHDGEHADAVKATLGEPMERLNMRWMYMDPDRGITADIYFDKEKVIGKTWSDPERGMQGKSPNVNKPGDVEHHNYKKVE